MNLDQKILSRLESLIQTGHEVLRTRSTTNEVGTTFVGDSAVSCESSSQWTMSCLNILNRVFGRDSDHYATFKECAEHCEGYSYAVKALGVLKAAKDDYENGYVFEARQLIQAEVFDEFLDQAQHLFNTGYRAPAAVIAGSVLEDGLRRLCIRDGITLSAKPKIDSMNSDLAKAGVYNVLAQKKITALADLRNKAAHGEWDAFTADDVGQMIAQIRSFMEMHFT